MVKIWKARGLWTRGIPNEIHGKAAPEVPATARPRFAESRPSGRSTRNVVVMLGALQALYLGEGDGRFRAVPLADALREGGQPIGVRRDWGLAARFSDWDGDGDPDLYVANDFGKNNLYVNRGDGTFEEASARLVPD